MEALYGTDLFGEPIENPKGGALSAQFTYPPFSVLNAREGWWQERKAAWLALGIKSEVGRGGGLLTTAQQVQDAPTTSTWPLNPPPSSGNG